MFIIFESQNYEDRLNSYYLCGLSPLLFPGCRPLLSVYLTRQGGGALFLACSAKMQYIVA
jgi:hypothetical protein